MIHDRDYGRSKLLIMVCSFCLKLLRIASFLCAFDGFSSFEPDGSREMNEEHWQGYGAVSSSPLRT